MLKKSDLFTNFVSRKFSDETGEFLLELSLGNILTVFETDLHVLPSQTDANRVESGYFTFGSFDWSVIILDGRDLFLTRLTGLDNPCRVQYRLVVGEGRCREDSGLLDQISDRDGRICGYRLKHALVDHTRATNGLLRVCVELQ